VQIFNFSGLLQQNLQNVSPYFLLNVQGNNIHFRDREDLSNVLMTGNLRRTGLTVNYWGGNIFSVSDFWTG